MAKIIQFPRAKLAPPPLNRHVAVTRIRRLSNERVRERSVGRRLLHLVHVCLWCIVVLTWPLWSWIIAIDLFFQLVRTIYYWSAPEAGAAWHLALHLLGAATLVTILFRQPGELK